MNGFIVVDKPAGMTSHDVVAFVRRTLRIKKVGHTGTLDPFATGVLPVAVGEGTKAIPYLDETVKEYRATMMLGVTTDTQDFTGAVMRECDWRGVTSERVREVLLSFTGRISQLPPMFSALKKNGVPLYRLARKGEEVEREPREVEIFSLTLDELDLPLVKFTVRCSRGTYVRTLAHDMGEKFGCGAHLTELRRTQSGVFTLAAALTPDQVAGAAAELPVLSCLDALAHLERVEADDEAQIRVLRGMPLDVAALGRPLSTPSGGLVAVAWQGALLAVARVSGDNERILKMVRVFPPVIPLQGI